GPRQLRLSRTQLTTTTPSVTVAVRAGRPRVVGPRATEPSSMRYWLPWQVHVIRPSPIWETRQNSCWQTASNARNSPATGWVTTTRRWVSITPPPTGTSETGMPSGSAGGSDVCDDVGSTGG